MDKKFLEHKKKHILLHKCLSELIADFIECTNQFIENYTIDHLVKWSYDQTINPTENEKHI